MRRLGWIVAFVVLGARVAAAQGIGVNPSSLGGPIVVFPASAVNGAGQASATITPLDGTATTPSVGWPTQNGLGAAGLFHSNGGVGFGSGGSDVSRIDGNGIGNNSANQIWWTSSNSSSINSSADLKLTRKAAGALLVTAIGAGAQLATTQTSPPTCSANCGTSVPAELGTDSDMVITMGSGGSPTSGFVVTFASTWAAAPSCVGSMALSSMVVGKMPIALVSTQTTLTVTTNGTAPAVSDKYNFLCRGVQ